MAKETIPNPNGYLQPEVAAAFEVVDWKWGFRVAFPAFSHITPNGNVNLKLLTVKAAEQLVDVGFPHLRKRLPIAPKVEKKAAKADE